MLLSQGGENGPSLPAGEQLKGRGEGHSACPAPALGTATEINRQGAQATGRRRAPRGGTKRTGTPKGRKGHKKGPSQPGRAGVCQAQPLGRVAQIELFLFESTFFKLEGSSLNSEFLAFLGEPDSGATVSARGHLASTSTHRSGVRTVRWVPDPASPHRHATEARYPLMVRPLPFFTLLAWSLDAPESGAHGHGGQRAQRGTRDPEWPVKGGQEGPGPAGRGAQREVTGSCRV